MSNKVKDCPGFERYSVFRKEKCKICGEPKSAHTNQSMVEIPFVGSNKGGTASKKELKKVDEKKRKDTKKGGKGTSGKNSSLGRGNHLSLEGEKKKQEELLRKHLEEEKVQKLKKEEEEKLKKEEKKKKLEEEEKKKLLEIQKSSSSINNNEISDEENFEEKKTEKKDDRKNKLTSVDRIADEDLEDSPRGRSQTMESRETIGNYILVDRLGKGAFAIVYKALNVIDGSSVAFKKLNLKGASKEMIEGLQEEINLLQSLSHINIVRYIEHFRKGKELYIVMEFVENGSLSKMVKKYGRFPESLAKTYVRKILCGLVYLHDQGVIHRDIKPDNILVTKSGEVKLADFGVSAKVNSLHSSNADAAIPAGTPYYMAPEVIEFLGAKPESDVWSLGCTVIELLRGEPPYYNHDPFSAMYKMVEDEHPPFPSGISQGLSDFLLTTFTKDANFRISAKNLLKHSWLAKEQETKSNLSNETIDFNRDTHVIDNYNKELEKELNKEINPESEEKELDTITKAMAAKFKPNKESSKKGNEAEALPKPSAKAVETPKKKVKIKPVEEEEEDWDEEMGFNLPNSDAQTLEESLKKLSLEPTGTAHGLFNNIDLDNIDFDLEEEEGEIEALSSKLNLTIDDDEWPSLDDAPVSVVASFKTPKVRTLKDFVEEKEEFDDGFEFGEGLKLVTNRNEEEGEWDNEEVFNEEEEEKPDEKVLLKEKAQEALLSEIKEHIETLKPRNDPEKIKTAAKSLMDLFEKNPEIRNFLISHHGVLPIINILSTENASLLPSILKLITSVIDNKEILLNLCLMGIIPVITKYASSDHPKLVRLYVAFFVQTATIYPEIFQMFIACSGLKVLVDFLEPDYEAHSQLVHLSLECITNIFKMQGLSTPKNAFFHLFLNAGLLERLSISLVNLITYANQTPEISSFSEKAANIFKNFATFGDAEVKAKIASPEVLENIAKALSSANPRSKECIALLNMIRSASFDRLTLVNLTIVIEPLLNIAMSFVKKREFVNEIFNQIIHSLFHLTKKNRPRQELATKCGLIPFLIFVVNNNKPLKDLAVPMICELASSSFETRKILLDNGGIHFYVELLKDPKGTFNTDSLDAIAHCLENDRDRVEDLLLKEDLNLLKDIFVDPQDNQIMNMLDSIRIILNNSVEINRRLGNNTHGNGLVEILKNRLHHKNPHVRVSLLRTLNSLCTKSEDPSNFLKTNKLLEVVQFMAKADSSKLVQSMAQQLLKEGKKY